MTLLPQKKKKDLFFFIKFSEKVALYQGFLFDTVHVQHNVNIH